MTDINNTTNKVFQPMFVQITPESSLPHYALPSEMLRTMDEAFEITKAPNALILFTVLGAMSLATQGLAKISVGENKSGNCGIFTLMIAEPSEGKTSCERLFFKPFLDWENKEEKMAKSEFARYMAEHHTWQASVNHIKAAIKREVTENATI